MKQKEGRTLDFGLHEIPFHNTFCIESDYGVVFIEIQENSIMKRLAICTIALLLASEGCGPAPQVESPPRAKPRETLTVATKARKAPVSDVASAKAPAKQKKKKRIRKKRPPPVVTADDLKKIQAALPKEARVKPKRPRKVLVFTLALGFTHGSIAVGAKALELMGRKTGAYEATVSDDLSMFEPENLQQFDAICMVNTTGRDMFQKKSHQDSLLAFVRSGKGITGFHAATNCSENWLPYGQMMGGYFWGHPWNANVTVTVKLDDPGHPLLAAFAGQGFEITDEIYQFRDPYSRDSVRVLLSLDTTKTNMKNDRIKRTDNDFAVSWVRSYGKGRVFYSSLGHNKHIWWNPTILKFYLDGIQFALGDLPVETAPKPRSDLRSSDAFVGRYAGVFHRADGSTGKAVADVLAEGGGMYRAVLRAEPTEVGAEALRIELRTGSGKGKSSGSHARLKVQRSKNANADAGLNYAYYEGSWDKLPDFDALTPVQTGVVKYFDIRPRERDDNYGFKFTGFVKIPANGRYTFFTTSDDGSRLFIGSKRVVDNDGLHSSQEKTGSIRLKKGLHPITVTFFEKGGDEILEIGYVRSSPGKPVAAGKTDGDDGIALTGKSGDVAWKGTLGGDKLIVTGQGERFVLEYVPGHSPYANLQPPDGAVVLLPLEANKAPALDAWSNASWQALADGSMKVVKGNNLTRRSFGDIRLHLEFMIPFEPAGRGQKRGNSGLYLQNRYEVQVLDSFGLAPGKGDCGALYGIAPPKVNASLPPLTWQTYDIIFRAARLDAAGKVRQPPVITVLHNGRTIHLRQELPASTRGAGASGHAAKGPLMLQEHGHPVRYRNIWLVEL